MNEFLRRILFLPPQRSTIARDIDSLHYFVISVTMAGSIVVFLTAALLVFRYRRRAHTTAPHREAGRRGNAIFFELGFLLLLLVLFLTWWVEGSRQFLRIRVPPENALEVYVTGKQWMWKFAYPSGRRTIADVYVPARRPIKLILTSRDVVHSFYVPDFRIKEDAIPGRYTTEWFEATEPGTYQVLCAEYCGTSHSTMRGQVVALDPVDYEKWLEEKPLPQPRAEAEDRPYVVGQDVPGQGMSLIDEGVRAAAEYGCLRCHTADGSSHIGPTWAGLFGTLAPLAKGPDARVDEAYITESMMDPQAKVVRGYEPVMPSYFGRIRPGETAAIIEYIKSLRDVPRLGPRGQDPGQVRLGGVIR